MVVLEHPLVANSEDRLEIMLKHGAVSNANQQACSLRDFSLSTTTVAHWTALVGSPERRAGWDRYNWLREEVRKAPATNVPVLLERPTPAERGTRIWLRGGSPDQSGGSPAKSPGAFESEGGTGRVSRLDMARWLVSEHNPLLGRVLASRLQAGMFGPGIEETLEGFGSYAS